MLVVILACVLFISAWIHAVNIVSNPSSSRLLLSFAIHVGVVQIYHKVFCSCIFGGASSNTDRRTHNKSASLLCSDPLSALSFIELSVWLDQECYSDMAEGSKVICHIIWHQNKPNSIAIISLWIEKLYFDLTQSLVWSSVIHFMLKKNKIKLEVVSWIVRETCQRRTTHCNMLP